MNTTFKSLVVALACGLGAWSSALGEALDTSPYRMKCAFTLSDAAKTAIGEGTLTDFPLLVRVSTDISGFSYADSNFAGEDVAFADADGEALAFELDTWNETGTSLYWVKVPSLSKDSTINMYYGAAAATVHTPSDVWKEKYAGVWHFNAAMAGTTNVVDATGNKFDATIASGNMATYEGPFVLPALQAPAKLKASDYDSKLTNVAVFSASGWFKMPNQVSAYHAVVSKKVGHDWADDAGWYVEMTQSKTLMKLIYGKATVQSYIPDVSQNWNYYHVVSDGSKMWVYINGSTNHLLTATYTVKASEGEYQLSDAESCGAEYRVRNGVSTPLEIACEYQFVANDALSSAHGVEPADQSSPHATFDEVGTGSDYIEEVVAKPRESHPANRLATFGGATFARF